MVCEVAPAARIALTAAWTVAPLTCKLMQGIEDVPCGDVYIVRLVHDAYHVSSLGLRKREMDLPKITLGSLA